jgi:hypothetical protein
VAQPIEHAPDLDRTRAQTSESVNEKIDRETRLRLQRAASRSPEDLTDGIVELGEEWDFDRIIEVEASLTGLTGLVLGTFVNRRFLIIPGFAAGMLLLHSVQGWYPLLPLLRRVGIRTQNEIDREYYAMKMLRGDFDTVTDASAAERAAAAWKAVIA